MSRSSTRRIFSTTLSICASPVRSAARAEPLLPITWPAAGAPGPAARAGGVSSRAGAAVPPSAAAPLPPMASARLVHTGQLKRASRWKLRRWPSAWPAGVASGLRKRSTRALTVVPNSVVSVCMRMAAPDRPNCSSAPRLAPTILPSALMARMPSISVPMNSTRLWKCSRITLR